MQSIFLVAYLSLTFATGSEYWHHLTAESYKPSPKPQLQYPREGIVIPSFEKVLIEPHFKDSYWIESFDINNDDYPDIVTSGLFSGQVSVAVQVKLLGQLVRKSICKWR